MYYSKYNLISKLATSMENSAEYALMNPLTGSFDLASADEIDRLKGLKENGDMSGGGDLLNYLLERGYIYKSKEEEEKLILAKKAEFDAITAETSKQLLLIPTYSCNLSCTYCFQGGIKGKHTLITKEAVDAFFEYAAQNFTKELNKPFVTLFGGEPLIYSQAQSEIIKYIIDKCNLRGYQLAVVTNGYNLEEYIDILAAASIREIQVTVDGPREVHDARRGMASGQGTYDKIMSGLDKAIARKFPINFRAVVDKTNLKALLLLADEIDRRGWLDLPPELFKTQIGRNYELFECYAKPDHLLDQVELWAEVARLSKEYPVLKKFHQPEFKGIKHLVQSGEMYLGSFDTCPACKTEWVFDLYGDIYGCTASCGREDFKLGTFYPEVKLNNEIITQWANRNITTIPQCRDCEVSLICGGGCGVMACNKKGSIQSPDCRPVKDLIDLGINYYQEEILKL